MRRRVIISKIQDELAALKVEGTFSTWPCLYGGDICLLVATKNGEPLGACIKAVHVEARGGRKRVKLLRKMRCPRPERKTLFGFTRKWECRFADGKIHRL